MAVIIFGLTEFQFAVKIGIFIFATNNKGWISFAKALLEYHCLLLKPWHNTNKHTSFTYMGD